MQNRIRLIRFEQRQDSVFGIIRPNFSDELYYSLENLNYIIPAGVYPLDLHLSSRFKIHMPIIENVKGRTYILIHGGNSIADTQGCIIAGRLLDLERKRIAVCEKVIHEITKYIKREELKEIEIIDAYKEGI